MLSKPNRLTTDFEFNITRKYGNKIVSPLFNVYHLKARNYAGPPRFGIVVANKISKSAVKRNKIIKRLIREAIRPLLTTFPTGTWTTIFASTKSLEAPYEEICTQINQALQKILISK